MVQSVCIFGDSLAKGVVLDETRNRYQLLKHSFVHLMEQRRHWKVANYAKFGITVKKGEQILQNTPDDLSQYDYTVLEFGGNDCNFNWAEVAENPLAPHVCQTPLEQFQQTYEWMIEQVRTRGGKPVALSLPPIDAQRYFVQLSRGLNADNILRFLGDIEHIYRWQAMYSAAVVLLAKAYRVPVIDIRAAFLLTEDYRAYLCKDGIHPNEKGHALIAQAIEQQARAYL